MREEEAGVWEAMSFRLLACAWSCTACEMRGSDIGHASRYMLSAYVRTKNQYCNIEYQKRTI